MKEKINSNSRSLKWEQNGELAHKELSELIERLKNVESEHTSSELSRLGTKSNIKDKISYLDLVNIKICTKLKILNIKINAEKISRVGKYRSRDKSNQNERRRNAIKTTKFMDRKPIRNRNKVIIY